MRTGCGRELETLKGPTKERGKDGTKTERELTERMSGYPEFPTWRTQGARLRED